MDLELIALGALLVVVVVIAIAVIRSRRQAPSAVTPALRQVEPVAFLERADEGHAPRIHALHKPLVGIGRGEDNDICIPAEVPGALTVSRRHAQIRREDLDFIVEDLGSQNGIQVNGLVTRRNLLRDGYRVSFGSVEFVFRRPHADDGPEKAE